jgi:hypothetical protein
VRRLLNLWNYGSFAGMLQVGNTAVHVYHIHPLNVFLAASWAITVWEGLVTFDDEVDFIWTCVRHILPSETTWNMTPSMPRTAHIKWLYFFGKYFALGLQT